MLNNEYKGIGRIVEKKFEIRKTKKGDDSVYFTVAIDRNGETMFVDCALYGKYTKGLLKYGINNPIIDFKGELFIQIKNVKGINVRNYVINIKEYQLFRTLDYKSFNKKDESTFYDEDNFFMELDEKTVDNFFQND